MDIKMLDAGQPITPFSGTRHEICDRSETGYYLGHAVIHQLLQHFDLHEIALLDNVEVSVKPVLDKLVSGC